MRGAKLGTSTSISKAGFLALLAETSTKRICFDSTHQHALKEWASSTKYSHRISLPFRKSIGPMLKEDTGIELHDSQQYGNVWCGLADNDADCLRDWIHQQGSTVFLRDLLDLSIALSNHFGDGGKVLEFYEIESRAKYQAEPAAIEAVVQAVCDAMTRLPFYRDADAISYVPPRPSKGFDLPSTVGKRVAVGTGKELLVAGNWSGDKGQLKETAVGEKWDRLEQAGFVASSEVSGKSVILLDDLYQSGCTMHFVASKLKEAGAARIWNVIHQIWSEHRQSMMWDRAKNRLVELAQLEGPGREGFFDDEHQSELGLKIDLLEAKFSQPVLCTGAHWGSLPIGLERLQAEDRVTFLFAIGNLDLLSRPAAGICGSRHASDRGLLVASAAVRLLCQQGVVITSGYAAGVDMMAHLTALQQGSATIVVLPEGLSRFSIRKDLRSHWDWSRILVLSQFSLNMPWKSWNAMRRNRTIMALSRLMLVVETRLTGGTYDAGKVSLSYGMPVFAVDFAESDEMSAGNKALIEMGAQPLRKSRITGEPSIESLVNILRSDPEQLNSEPGSSHR